MTHVAIIGGGPAGLVTASQLASRGIPFTVLERGDRPFAALRALDPEMRLLTPGRFSRLPGMTPRPGEPEYQAFGEVVDQFERWRSARGVTVEVGAQVERVTQLGDRFVVNYTRTSGPATLQATHVVSAAGVISHPNVPRTAASYAGRWKHSLDVRTEDLRAARTLVVVGAGMSAAEVLERYLEVRRPGDQAWIATNRAVRAAPSKILGIDIHWYLWAPELFPGRLLGRRIGPERDLIIGRSVLGALRDGSIKRIGVDEGLQLDPELLVFATGYSYATEHLEGLVELDGKGHPIVDHHSASVRAPNLYLLGLRFGRTVASSALRGIVRDAAHVAKRIAGT